MKLAVVCITFPFAIFVVMALPYTEACTWTCDRMKFTQDAFDTIDKNRDGFITQDEIEAFCEMIESTMHMPCQINKEKLNTMDTDHDGRISREEFQA